MCSTRGRRDGQAKKKSVLCSIAKQRKVCVSVGKWGREVSKSEVARYGGKGNERDKYEHEYERKRLRKTVG